MWPVHNILRGFFLLIPVDSNAVPFIHYQLISAVGVGQPPAEMFFFRKFFHVRGVILVVDASFPSVSIDIRELIDCEGMLPIERGAMEGFCGGDCLFWRFVLYKGVALIVSHALRQNGFDHTLLTCCFLQQA